MLFLLLTIALNAYIFVVFKIFERFEVDTLQAIVVNYWTCVITGSIFLGHFPVQDTSLQAPWLPWSILMGCSFISIFNLIGFCTRVDGITTTTIANKLSMVIPVAFAVYLYADHMTPAKGLGIALAFPAVYLSTRVKEDGKKGRNLFWPVLLFLSSGLLDTLVNFVVNRYFSGNTNAANSAGQSIFIIHAFGAAAIVGTTLVSYLLVTRRRVFAWKNVLAGIALGVPNYFSIYYLFRLLQSGFLPGSAAIPVNNIGIVLAASITAIVFFREKTSLQRIMGMVLSVAAILLIMLSDLYVRST